MCSEKDLLMVTRDCLCEYAFLIAVKAIFTFVLRVRCRDIYHTCLYAIYEGEVSRQNGFRGCFVFFLHGKTKDRTLRGQSNGNKMRNTG